MGGSLLPHNPIPVTAHRELQWLAVLSLYIGSSDCYGTQFSVKWGTSMVSVVHGHWLLRSLATRKTRRLIVVPGWVSQRYHHRSN